MKQQYNHNMGDAYVARRQALLNAIKELQEAGVEIDPKINYQQGVSTVHINYEQGVSTIHDDSWTRSYDLYTSVAAFLKAGGNAACYMGVCALIGGTTEDFTSDHEVGRGVSGWLGIDPSSVGFQDSDTINEERWVTKYESKVSVDQLINILQTSIA